MLLAAFLGLFHRLQLGVGGRRLETEQLALRRRHHVEGLDKRKGEDEEDGALREEVDGEHPARTHRVPVARTPDEEQPDEELAREEVDVLDDLLKVEALSCLWNVRLSGFIP